MSLIYLRALLSLQLPMTRRSYFNVTFLQAIRNVSFYKSNVYFLCVLMETYLYVFFETLKVVKADTPDTPVGNGGRNMMFELKEVKT